MKRPIKKSRSFPPTDIDSQTGLYDALHRNYTSGELVAERIPGYIPYADKNGLWARAWNGPDHGLIEQDWKPHMNGTVGLQQSLGKLVNDLAPTAPSN